MAADLGRAAEALPDRLGRALIALWHRLPATFERQLHAIGHRAEAYHFDDGYDDVLRAADGLEQLGLQGVFFIIGSRIGKPGHASRAMLRELAARGHEVGNHTHTHRSMPGLPADDVRRDIEAAQLVLADIVGTRPQRLAWPHGHHDPVTDAVAAEFGFVEVRDISNVVHNIAGMTRASLRRLFR